MMMEMKSLNVLLFLSLVYCTLCIPLDELKVDSVDAQPPWEESEKSDYVKEDSEQVPPWATEKSDEMNTAEVNEIIANVRKDLEELPHNLRPDNVINTADQQDDGDDIADKEDISNEIAKVNEESSNSGTLYGGDMVLTAKQIIEVETGKNVSGDAVKNSALYWKDNVVNGEVIVHYVFDRRANERIKKAVKAAIAEYNQKTCIRFKQGNGRERNFIKFINGGGCYSLVGKYSRPGQPISLMDRGRGRPSCAHKGIAVHEMMHALGYYHEQSRPDRDQYIEVLFKNIVPRARSNFNKQKTDAQGTDYDFSSVMHYGSTAFARRRGLTTIRIRRKEDQGKQLGQREGLSAIDQVQLNKLYCGGRGSGGGKPTRKPLPGPGPGPGGPGPGPGPPSSNCLVSDCSKASKLGLCNRCDISSKCLNECSEKDRNPNCSTWAKRYCEGRFKKWMAVACNRSCRKLGFGCTK